MNNAPTRVWAFRGPHGATVTSQANTQAIPAFDGVWDITDITAPSHPRKLTGLVGAIGMRYALYYLANHGQAGHTYRLEPRSDASLRSWRIGL